MRTIQSHKVNEANDAISITADERDEKNGNASHAYVLEIARCTSGGSPITGNESASRVELSFQNGPIKEFGVNGLTNEALLAVVIDRMEGFQAGHFACRENALALTKLQEARMWLLERTRGRAARGVEGTHQK